MESGLPWKGGESIHTHRNRNACRFAGYAAAALLGVLLAGCAAAPRPYQPRSSADLLYYGYTDTKVDALHYSVVYSDSREDRAQNFLELRAAQIAQGAGAPYFAFDQRGTRTLTKTEHEFEQSQVAVNSPRGKRDMMTTIPSIYSVGKNAYHYAWGNVSLLTADQARANPKALQVSEVLEQLGSNLAP